MLTKPKFLFVVHGISNFVLLILSTQVKSYAQAGDTLKLTLQQCVEYALKNSSNLKNATLDQEIADARVREIRGIGLPQIIGSAGLQHFFKLRNAYLPGNSPFGMSSPQIDPTTGQPIPPPQLDVMVLPPIFQLSTNLDASLNASQILFNSSYIVGLQAAKTYKALSERAAKQSKEQIIVNVKKAYLLNLVNLERIKLFDINISRLDSSLRQVKALQKNGFVETLESDRLEVSLNNLITEYEKTLQLLVLASLQLKFQMGMPIEQNIILIDSLKGFTEVNVDVNTPKNIEQKTEFQLLKLQVRGMELDLKNNKWAALPSLVLSGGLGVFSSSDQLNIFEKRSIGVVGNDFQPKGTYPRNQALFWSDYSFVQLGMQVPIFSGFTRSAKVQQSRLNVQKAQNNLKNYEQAYGLQWEAAKVNVLNSQKTLMIQKRNMQLAQNVSNNTYKKYKAGMGSNLEVTNAEAALKEAQVNYFNALYEYLVNTIEFELASGNIN